jgi:ElaB/YqjD/DUF883 family membrane-anchored ribosome-binding protein
MEMTRELEDTARQIEERVRPQIEQAKRRLSELNGQATTYIKANPGKCLLGALAVGYIIGKIASR